MKKIIAIAICVFMIVSVFAVCAFAEESLWNAVGDVNATYDPDIMSKITWDGHIDDWEAANVTSRVINYYNMDTWLGVLDPNFEITVYFAADETNLYVAFWIIDETKGLVPDENVATLPLGAPSALDGDTFQIQFDVGKTLTEAATFRRAVFYSFARRNDGKMLLEVNAPESGRSEIEGIQKMVWADEAGGKLGVHGGCAELADGWSAEIAIPWQLVYEHMYYKLVSLYEDEMAENFEVAFGPDDPLISSMNICYLNANAPLEDGSFGGTNTASCTPRESGMAAQGMHLFPDSAGINLIVTPDKDLKFNNEDVPTCKYPDDTSEDETLTEESSGNETVTEELPTSTGEETEAPTSGNNETQTDAQGNSENNGGCGSVIGLGSVALIALTIGTVAFKKKKKF